MVLAKRFILDVGQDSEYASAFYNTISIRRLPISSIMCWLEKFLQLKNCSFLNLKKLFPRNPFHVSHSEEYRWSQGGPRKILGVPSDSAGSRRLEEASRVPEGPGTGSQFSVMHITFDLR